MAEDVAPRPPPLCQARRVSHEFRLPAGPTIQVLEEVDLEVGPREVVALLGPSGCGKSTILRILAGLIRPTSGEVLYHGAPLAGLNPGVGFVFQSFALFPWMTVNGNIECVLEAAGLPRDRVAERVEEVVRLVSLSGFEGAFPRELSGGMKQRVGIARALAVDPEILFLDEPFSQVDALTAESLRAEVIDIWARQDRNPVSILLVSHDIKEVVYMADRIVLLSAKPGRVKATVANPLPRPRDYRTPEFQRLVDSLHDAITGHELPDLPAAAPAAPGTGPVEVLPRTTPGEVIGLLEYLDARGGQEDLFRIAADTDREFGRLITVVKAAELLDFVDTPKRSVILEPAGREFLAAGAADRRRLWGEHYQRLRLPQEILTLLRASPDGTVGRNEVMERIVLHMPREDSARVFETCVRWARYGGVFSYDDRRRRLVLPRRPARPPK